MKILITGATGLVGKDLGKKLSELGHELIAVSRSKEKALLDLPFACEIVEWNGGVTPFPTHLIPSLDAVVNLMGENLADHRWNKETKKRFYESRVTSTATLVKALSPLHPKVWIQGSAIGFYGAMAQEENANAFDEFSPKGSDFLAQLCDEWEQAIDPLPAPIRRVILRTGVVLSHRGGAAPKMISPMLMGLGGSLGSGRQHMSLIHLADVVNFICFALENKNTKTEVKGVFNLVANESIAQKELNQRLCALLHVRVGPSVPAFALKLVVGEMAEVLLENQPVISKRLSEVSYKLEYPSVDAILQEIAHWYQDPFDPKKSAFVQYSEQLVQRPLPELFSFFMSPKNLEAITPPWISIQITRISSEEVKAGTEIEYSMKVHGVPMKWVTDICIWDPPHRFVDNQRKGPYSLWYHEHAFKAVAQGVLMTDWVRYRLPAGRVGATLGSSKIKSDVDAIFQFRREYIQKEFGVGRSGG